VQIAEARKEAVAPFEALAGEPEQRWTRRSRFLFIVGAAALCWAVPGIAIYLMVAPL
jgi:hypothetical protein